MRRLTGNGDTGGRIVFEDKGPGYIVFSPDNLLTIPQQFYAHLSMKLSEWLKKNPDIVVRSTLTINDDHGQTVLLHVWYDGPMVWPTELARGS
jgi:hypothetical protein